MLTLNQLIEILRNFSLKHKQLNSFYFGDQWEVGASGANQYPLMWCSLINSKYDKSGVVTNTFQIDISDLVNSDESNENHVLSDMQLVCFDFLNYLEQISDDSKFNFTYNNTSTLTDYTEKRDDSATGWYFTVDIITHIGLMSCDLPINSGTIFDGNYIYINGQTSPCLPVLIKDQNGNVVATVAPGGIYTVEVLTQVIQTLGNVTPTIIQTL